MKGMVKKIGTRAFAMLYALWFAPMAQAYSFDMIVPDVRQPTSRAEYKSCHHPDSEPGRERAADGD